MTAEQERTREALQMAIQMEIDGRECYLGASRQSSNEVGRKLLRQLADEEELHQRKLVEIYEAISRKKAWPAKALEPDRGLKLRSSFVGTCQAVGVGVKGAPADFDAIKTAIEKEKKSYDFYHRQGQAAVYGTEREFYEAVVAEEREHELLLLDYYEYLADPAGWFVKAEHPSLDGG
jgi:rubrerythrin